MKDRCGVYPGAQQHNKKATHWRFGAATKRGKSSPVISMSTSRDKPRKSEYQPGGTMVEMMSEKNQVDLSKKDRDMGRLAHISMIIKASSATK